MINVIFVCLLSCCSWFMPLKDNLSCKKQDQIQEVEEKTRNNFYQGNYDTYYYSMTDIMSPVFFGNLLNYCNNMGQTYILPSNQNNVSTFTVIQGVSSRDNKLPINIMYRVNYQSQLQVVAQVTDITLKKTYSNGIPYYDMYIYFYDNGIVNLGFSYIFIQYTTFTSYTDNSFTSVGEYTPNSPSLNILQNLCFSENYTSNPHFLYDMLTNDNELSDASAYYKGYEQGFNYASQEILNDPNNDIYQSVYSDGVTYGYQNGYADGLQDGLDTDSTALTIFTGIIDVGLLPVNVFIKMFNYEIFGINIAGLVSGLLTIAIVIIIIRIITGQKNGK